MKKVKLLLCDDHALMRNGMSAIFGREDWIEVVGTVESGEAAVNFVARTETDIVLMDIVMQGMSGVEATRWIKEQNPAVKVILVSGEITAQYITNGIKAGAHGYVLKHSPESLLLRAIRTVSNGEHFFGPDVLSMIMSEVKPNIQFQVAKESESEKTKAFISMLVTGLPMAQIEEWLSLPLNSGSRYCSQIMKQLKIGNMTEMVHYALVENIIKL